MSFDPGGGGIANANDVALNNPADTEVLTYDGGIAKWTNDPLGSGSTVLDMVAGTTTVNNDATPNTVISGFSVSDATTIAVNDVWHISGEILYTAATGADIKLKVIIPAGSTAFGRMTGIDLAASDVDATHTSVPITTGSVTASFGGIGVSSAAVATIDVRVVVGSVDDFNISFSQNSAAGSDATIVGGSWILAARAASS